MNKKMLILIVFVVAVFAVSNVMAAPVLIDVSGTIYSGATGNNPAVNTNYNIKVGSSTFTGTTDNKGRFSRLVSTDANCGTTIELDFYVGGNKVGTYPVIACTQSTLSVPDFIVTNKFEAPITYGVFYVSKKSSGNAREYDILDEWDLCTFSGISGKNLGGSGINGCGVNLKMVYNDKGETGNVAIEGKIEGQKIIQGQPSDFGGKIWQMRAKSDGGARTHCNVVCIRFNI